ncbi:PD40 domain-containing protein, partial [Candidatus Saccharibacteria bacterium]|nr:PD40 domain-containing protein [Candidatus Saccharibacteria bacterium]
MSAFSLAVFIPANTRATGGFITYGDNKYDLTAASLTHQKSISAQAAFSADVNFNNDGSKMYVVDTNSPNIYEYSLSNPFDISTAYYPFYSVASQEGTSQDVVFNPTGTKMYVMGASSDKVWQYTLSTPFDATTATINAGTDFKSIISQDTTATGFRFNDTGSKMYVIGTTADKVWQYTLSTPYDVTTATINAGTDFKLISAQETNAGGLNFNTTGTKMYVIGTTSDKVWQYTLSTPFDVTTATINAGTDFKSIVTQDSTSSDVTFNDDGTKMYVIGSGNDKVWQYTLSSAFDVTTATINAGTDFKYIGTQDPVATGVKFNDDGTKMCIIGQTSDGVNEFSLSTPYDVTTAKQPVFSVSSQDNIPNDIVFNSDGTNMYILGRTNRVVYQYSLSTAYDITSASYTQSFSVAAQEATPTALDFNSDGTKMFVLGASGDSIYEYDLGTGFDVSTAGYIQSFPISNEDIAATGIAFSANGTRMFIVGQQNHTVYMYRLTTAFDISTAAYVNSYYIGGEEAASTGLAFSNDGSSMYVVGTSGNKVNQYSTTGTASGFTEDALNNGLVNGQLVFELNGDTFQDNNADDILDIGTEVIVNNIPAGLNPQIVLSQNDTVATMTFDGSPAINHENVNDVADITFEFDNSAFMGGDASAITGATGPASSGFGIDFNDRLFIDISRISVDSNGAESNSSSVEPSVSRDGRYTAYASDADNLVANDTNGSTDVFLYDSVNETTTRVSVDSNGNEGNNISYGVAISSDGRYITYYSDATNLVSGDANGATDVFLYDSVNGTTTRVSVDSNGNEGNGASFQPAISGDGRYITYTSSANNLVTGDNNGVDDIFRYDRIAGTTTRISIDSNGNESDNNSSYPSISGNGRYIVYNSDATNLVSDDNNGAADVFLYDTESGTTSRVSVDSNGNEGNGSVFWGNPSISSDGKYVVFSSNATNMVSGDTNAK